MNKDKERRYQSMRELKFDLQRALREPNAEIAAKPVGERFSAPILSSSLGGIFQIGIITLVLVGMFVAVFFIAKTMNNNSQIGEIVFVPTLLERTERDAEDSCKRLGLKMMVIGRESHPEVGEGRVFSQEPREGTEAKTGDSVNVRVSLGPPTTLVPEVLGLPLYDALDRLAINGINDPEIAYEYSNYPDGIVLRVFPVELSELDLGESVTLWVSGESDERAPVPLLIGMQVKDAVEDAKNFGFAQVIIRTMEDAEDGEEGTVYNQLPTASEIALPDTTIELWIRPPLSAYGFDLALNVTIPANDNRVLVVLEEGIAQYILFEENMMAGKQVIPLAIRHTSEGERDVVVYVEGEEVRRQSVLLVKR